MTKSELRMAQALQDGCKTLCTVADAIDPKRERRGLAEQVDKIVVGMATTFNELTGQNIFLAAIAAFCNFLLSLNRIILLGGRSAGDACQHRKRKSQLARHDLRRRIRRRQKGKRG